MRTLTIHEAVDALVQRKRILLFKDENGHNVRGDVPSLIEQLEAAVSREGRTQGSGGSQSRPPVAVGVLQLVTEIAVQSADAVRERNDGKHLHNIEANLKRVAADRANLPPTDDDVTAWIERLQGWERKARTVLGIEPKYPTGIRGAACPSCGANYTWGTNDYGEKCRVPVLQFAWSEQAEPEPDQLPKDRTIRAVECVMCGETWWAGAQFWQLQAQIQQVIHNNQTRETLAE